MTAIWSNLLLLAVASVSLGVLAVALLWRVSAWYVSAADVLINDEGLPIGAAADQIAAYNASGEFHLTFGQGAHAPGLRRHRVPALSRAAARRPGPSRDQPLRKVFVSDDDLDPSEENVHEWETYVLADSWHTRRQWRRRPARTSTSSTWTAGSRRRASPTPPLTWTASCSSHHRRRPGR